MVKISVVMPVYNAERFLEDSVNSILNQTLDDLELICVDDGSTDNSLDMLKEFSKNDERVKVFSLNHKGGGNARNYGLKQITGKYLFCMDADDALDLNAFEDFYKISEEKDLDFLVFKAINYSVGQNYFYETEYEKMTNISKLVKDNVFNYKDLGDLLFDFNVSPWCKFYNSEFIKNSGAKFRENSKFHDNQFFWDMIFQAERIYLIDEFYYTRKRHDNSLTGSGDKGHINIIGVVNDIIKLFIKHDELDNYKNILYNLKIKWIIDRYNRVQEQYKEEFFQEMKNDFELNKNTEFEELLDKYHIFIFNNALMSNNHDEFDSMRDIYDKNIREIKTTIHEVKDCISIMKNEIEKNKPYEKNKTLNRIRSEKMRKRSYDKIVLFKQNYLNPKESLQILDIGSFDENEDYDYRLIFNEKNWGYHCLDLREGNDVDIVVKNPYDWKEINDETYDVVIFSQGFEHIEFFWITLEQIKRVLKHDGLFCIIVPSSGPVHKNPYDCYRFNEDAMKAFARYVNFEILKTGTDFNEHTWQDSYLIAKKQENLNVKTLKNRSNSLKNKLNMIISK